MSKPILFLINTLGAGGAERQLLYLLSGLDRDSFSPVVCTIFNEAAYPSHPPYVERLRELGVPLHTLGHGSGWSGRITAVRRYVQLLWQLRPTIVQGFLHYANLIARVARPLCPPHRLLTSARDEYLAGEIRSEALTWRLDDLLICNATQVREQVLRHTRRPPHRVHVIVNGISAAAFAKDPDPGLRLRLLGEVPFVLGYVGRIAFKKRLLVLVEALSRLPDSLRHQMKVFLLGEVSEPAEAERIAELIERCGLLDTVHRFDAVTDVVPYYHAADVLILPSLMEGFPNVVVEAFAAGKPVIVSEGANRAGLVEPGNNGWEFPTDDAEALASLIEQVMKMPAEQRVRMGQHAQTKAAQFTVERMVTAYSELYGGLLNQAQ